MAGTKLAFLAVAVLLLQASWCALSQLDGTAAVMAVTSFEQGQDGGSPAACDGNFHSDNDLLAALSAQWYAAGSRCNKQILILGFGKTVLTTVVDECDSQSGCKDNTIATSKAVWEKFGLDTDAGEVAITWVDST